MKRLVTAKGMFVPEPYDSQLQLKTVDTDADILPCSYWQQFARAARHWNAAPFCNCTRSEDRIQAEKNAVLLEPLMYAVVKDHLTGHVPRFFEICILHRSGQSL